MPVAPAPKTAGKIEKLNAYYQKVKQHFHDSHQHASSWLKTRSLDVEQLRQTSQQLLAAASLAGSIAINSPVNAMVAEKIKAMEASDSADLASLSQEEHDSIVEKLKQFVRRPPGHLEKEEELYMEQQLSDLFGFAVAAQLEGNRLNHSIGIMGGEQHLRRFPTDSLAQHDEYQESGIAPNRGAFGWFTEDGLLTDKAIEKEKYYFAVQTLYLPNWNTDHPELKKWYKFRKMIAINPEKQLA